MRKLIISLARRSHHSQRCLAQPAPAHAPAPAAAIISAAPLGGVTCWLEPTGFAPALKGVAGEAVAAARRRSRFPADWRSARGGWSAR